MIHFITFVGLDVHKDTIDIALAEFSSIIGYR